MLALFFCVPWWVLDVHIARTVRSLTAFSWGGSLEGTDRRQVPLDTLVIALVLACSTINTLAFVGTAIIPLLTLRVQFIFVQAARCHVEHVS